jgi:hypothetical protein
MAPVAVGEDGVGGDLHQAAVEVLGAGQRLLGALLLGDVGVGGDHPAAGQRGADDIDHRAVRPAALEAVRQEMPRQFHPLAHQRLGVAGPVLAALGVVADEVLEGRTVAGEGLGEAEQFNEAPVAADHFQLGIHHADALVHVFQNRAQQRGLLDQAVFGLHLAGDFPGGAVVADEGAAFVEARLALGLHPADRPLGIAHRIGEAERSPRLQIGAVRCPLRLAHQAGRDLPAGPAHEVIAGDRGGLAGLADETGEAVVAVLLPVPLGGDVGGGAEALLALSQLAGARLDQPPGAVAGAGQGVIERRQQQADDGAAGQDGGHMAAPRLAGQPGRVGAVLQGPLAAAEFDVHALAQDRPAVIPAQFGDQFAGHDRTAFGQPGVLDQQALAGRQHGVEIVAEGGAGLDREDHEALQGEPPLMGRMGRGAAPVDRGPQHHPGRPVRALHDLEGFRDMHPSAVARQADGVGVARLGGGVEAQRGTV